jgi:tRNA-intron endonuclease, archaea type
MVKRKKDTDKKNIKKAESEKSEEKIKVDINKEIEINSKLNTEKKESRKQLIECFLYQDYIITECSNEARQLQEKSCFGTILEDGRVQLTLIEGYYLCDKNKIIVKSGNKINDKEKLLKKCMKLEKNFLIRYAVYCDFRNRGYVIKTALKFGADFRVYNKGIKPGEDHARWIVYPVKETDVLTWYEFAAKNRVAHSTKKRLLLGIVDEENSVTYYEVKWTRP